jgi:cytochrome c oxidase subunit 2
VTVRRRRRVRLLLLAAGAGVVGGCIPEPASAEGRDIAGLYALFNGLAIAIGLFVAGLISWSVLRYRRRRGDDTLPKQTRGHLGLELAWTGIPALIVVGLFVATVLVLTRVDSTEATPGTELEVTAFRWGWTFAYTDEDVSVSGLGVPGPVVVVPVGEPIRLTMRSADVIHSLAIPQFLFKRDVNPGFVNVFQFTVEKPGDYGGMCTEFCGIYHSQMPFTLRAVSRSEYEAWLAEQPASPSLPPSLEPATAS